jgi:hypothetical protein
MSAPRAVMQPRLGTAPAPWVDHLARPVVKPQFRPSLIFIDPPTLASKLEKGRKVSGNQWMALCPCHGDTNPSLSIRWGRNGETLVHCFAACTQNELLDHFRSLGFTLKPVPPPPPKKLRRPVTVATSVALRACTLSERRMLSLIMAGGSPTYDLFEAEGARRTAIPGGLRALEALGLIDARRKARKKGCLRYDRNQYWTSDQWRRWEPSSRSKAAKKEALAGAKAVAAAARRAKRDVGKPEPESPDIRPPEVTLRADASAPSEVTKRHLSEVSIPEVPPRGVDSCTDSYEKESLGANESRTAPYEGSYQGKSAHGDGPDAIGAAPRRHGDPGPTSADGYGIEVAGRYFDPGPDSDRLSRATRQAGLCRYACAKAGECVEPGGVCVQRRAAAGLPPSVGQFADRRRSVSARGRTSEWR